MLLTKFNKAATEDLNNDNQDDPDLVDFVDDTDVPVATDDNDDSDDGTDLPEDDSVVIDDIDDEVEGVESLQMQIEHLQNLYSAIEQFGISPGMMQVADRDGLLSSTFSMIAATETLAGPYSPTASTSVAALEGIGEAIKNKVTEWAVKAGSAAKSLAVKAGHLLSTAASKVADLGRWVGSKTWNATKALGRTVKAHPYKTAAIVVGTIVAVAAVVALCVAFPAAPAAVVGWFGKIKTALASIKSPFGAISARIEKKRMIAQWVKAGSFDMGAGDASAMVPERISALGWTKATAATACSTLSAGLGKVVSAVGRIGSAIANSSTAAWAKRSATTVGKGVLNKVDGYDQLIENTNSGYAKHAMKFGYAAVVSFAITTIWLLLVRVVMAGYRFVTGTVKKVTTAASDDAGGNEAGAEA